MLVWSIAGITALLAIATALPLLPVAHGAVRVLDFPRLHLLTGAALVLGATLVLMPVAPLMIALVTLQLAVLGIQGIACLRYMPIWRVQSQPFTGAADDPSIIRILVSNVKMSNRNSAALVKVVRDADPHVAAFLEVDDRWVSDLKPLGARLPFALSYPQDNSYGMLLLSRLRLAEAEVRYLVSEQVPSIRTAVVLPNDRRLRLYVLHPEPPVPHVDTVGRDGELILLAGDVASESLPVVVTGDLNDVAWSHTTRRFQRLTGLFDPRVGRGIYSSFDARYPILRWPLDHLFHDSHFRLVRLTRLPHIGSDHFPMLFELALAEDAAGDAPERPSSGDIEEAEDLVEDTRNLDRDPVGTDWES